MYLMIIVGEQLLMLFLQIIIFNIYIYVFYYSISSSTIIASVSATTSTLSSPVAYWCFDVFRRGDVYSYALIMWEVMSRTLITADVNDAQIHENDQKINSAVDNEYDPYKYRAPYQDRGVGWDPGFDDMRQVVCSSDPVLSRPGIADEWIAHPVCFILILYHYIYYLLYYNNHSIIFYYNF